MSDRPDPTPDLSPDDLAPPGAPAGGALLPDDVLDRLVAAARTDRPVTADDVARRETDRALGHTTRDAARIDAAVAADADLAAEAERVRERLRRLGEEMESPAAQFARLTGRTLDATEATRAVPAAPPRRAHGRQTFVSDRAAAAPPRQHRMRAVRRVLVSACVVLVAYGGAAAVSSQQRPERARMASLNELTDWTPPQTRGDADADAEALAVALEQVDDARRTTLGLFPRYEREELDAAASELRELATRADASTSVGQEARFALARVRLYQARDADAARLLGALVRDGSYRAPEARRLIDWIRAQAP